MSLVDLPTAKLHLRAEGSDEDALIGLYLNAAALAASEYLNRAIYADVVAQGEDAAGIVVNDAIKAAILLTLGGLYSNREDVVTGVSVARLPNGAQYLLHPYRIGLGV